MAKSLEVGQPAPDFTLPALHLVDGKAVRDVRTLSQERGHPVVLAFYPGDDTSVCTKQMCSYSSGLEAFTDLGATVWGISPQDIDSHEKFAVKHGLRMPLLADTDRTAVAASAADTFAVTALSRVTECTSCAPAECSVLIRGACAAATAEERA